MNIFEIKTMQNSKQLSEITNYLTVAVASNTYTLDLAAGKNFSITISDTAAKAITLTNPPQVAGLLIQVSVLLTYTNAAAIAYPAAVVWKDGDVPLFTTGKKYLLLFTSYDSGTTWLASFVGEW